MAVKHWLVFYFREGQITGQWSKNKPVQKPLRLIKR